ncbi:MAG: hypothetical protein QOF33_2219 [Thermomicrobiales bacterium]|jgi:predicted protein tyrosine phosphatase|nr:hypothetical protein [Thermomicrobiales bacterium]
MRDPIEPPRKLLFVCSRNRIRSLTAERLFSANTHVQVRSAGTAADARIRVTAGHIGWADVVFVMEKRHRDLLRSRFPEALSNKRVVCLFVPDDYAFMADDLIDLLLARLAPHLELPHSSPDRRREDE